MSKRIKIPHKIEVKILVKNKHSCCICRNFKTYQEPVIHHIDGDPTNNRESNLAVLCLTHASMADAGLRKGKLGSGKKLKPDEVRWFKKAWEEKVFTETKIEKRTVPLKERKQLEILYKFEISKRKHEILSLPREEQRARLNHYEFLQELVFEEWIGGLELRPLLVDAFQDIAFQSLNQDFIQIPLIEAVSHLFLHLVGPEDVKISSDDKKLLLQSLDVLRVVGEFEAEFSDEASIVLERACKKIYELSEICSWYKFKEFLTKAKGVLNLIKSSCLEYKSEQKTGNRDKLIKKRLDVVNGTISLVDKLR